MFEVLVSPPVRCVLTSDPHHPVFRIYRHGGPPVEREPHESLVTGDPSTGESPTAGDLVWAWAAGIDRTPSELLAAMRYLRRAGREL